MSENNPIPSEIGRANEHDIRIVWSDAHESIFPARTLRLECPCAMCVDELTGVRTLDPDRVAQDVAPRSLEIVGRYAVRVYWSDSHSSGIYTFRMLRKLCPCDDCSR